MPRTRMVTVRALGPFLLEDGAPAYPGEVYRVSEDWAVRNSRYLIVEPQRKRAPSKSNKKLRAGENK
jgi:hypothetical protein